MRLRTENKMLWNPITGEVLGTSGAREDHKKGNKETSKCACERHEMFQCFTHEPDVRADESWRVQRTTRVEEPRVTSPLGTRLWRNGTGTTAHASPRTWNNLTNSEGHHQQELNKNCKLLEVHCGTLTYHQEMDHGPIEQGPRSAHGQAKCLDLR